MKNQNYQNHVRYYTQHHFMFYPVVIFLFCVCVYNAFNCNEHKLLWLVFAAIIALIGWLSFMVRQHYALGNQNRIVRLEMRFRYYRLTQKNFEEIEQQLSLSQILALRFAADEELLTLIERTIKEKLTTDEIKRSVKNWNPDHMRA
ncbi:MAG: DUF6526 family protein [Bacteroidota bacterium]